MASARGQLISERLFDVLNFSKNQHEILVNLESRNWLNWENKASFIKYIYRISANSFRGNYSFLEAGVRQVFKGGNYSREETIVF